MARSGRNVPAAGLEEALDDAVLQAVEGNHRQAAAGTKRPLGGPESLLQLVKLCVQMDSDGLEGAGRGIALLALAIAERPPHHRRQLGRSGQRSCGDDGAGNRAGARLLPIVLEDAGNLALFGMVEEFGGGLARLAHPHVERTVLLEGKAAVGLVELHRRYADVERDAVDRQQPALGQHPVHLAEPFLDQR